MPLGAVVVRPVNMHDTAYLVTSPMDGSGRRVLVTLGGGTQRPEIGPDELVFPIPATLTLGTAAINSPPPDDDVRAALRNCLEFFRGFAGLPCDEVVRLPRVFKRAADLLGEYPRPRC